MRRKICNSWRVMSVALALACNSAAADVVAVVSTNSPVTTLTRSQVADLFLGRITRFPDGSSAVPIDQGEGSAARDEFYKSFASKSAAQVKAYWSKIIFTGRGQPPRTATNDAQIKQLLATNPQAISYLDRRVLDSSVRVLTVQ